MQLIMNLPIRKKLIVGFGLVACICLAIGFVGWYGARQLENNIQETGEVSIPGLQAILTLKEAQTSIKASQRTLLNPSLALNRRQDEYKKVEASFKRANTEIEMYAALTLLKEEKADWTKFLENWNAWKSDIEKFLELNKKVDAIQVPNPQKLTMEAEYYFGSYKTWAAESVKAVLEQIEYSGNLNMADSEFNKWLSALSVSNPDVQGAVKQLKRQIESVYSAVAELSDFLSIQEFDLAKDVYIGEVLPSIESIQIYVDDLLKPINLSLEYYNQLDNFERKKTSVSLARTEAVLDKIVKHTNSQTTNNARKGKNLARNVTVLLLAATLLGVLAALALAFFISGAITKPINRIVEGLNEGADQVVSASGHVSSSSQQLADGSSEQAASIEETSSSLEEMSSMTKQNADNANQADNLMKEANQVVKRANDSMTELTCSMEEISKASEETSKIIKTIDEIAFQTNLLALNAAVEAARAGEAGAGFAVVADEVRNLAMRAADAARNTADLIEGTVKKVNEGGGLVATTNEAFSEVADSSSKVGELVGEIAAASNEQAEGIEQINKAVVEMDKVVQQNAANAEESASASEEMNAQAEQMKGFVDDLVTLVGGSAGAAKRVFQTQVRAPKAVTTTRALAAPAQKAPAVHQAKEVSPEQVILMDDDFKDL